MCEIPVPAYSTLHNYPINNLLPYLLQLETWKHYLIFFSVKLHNFDRLRSRRFWGDNLESGVMLTSQRLQVVISKYGVMLGSDKRAHHSDKRCVSHLITSLFKIFCFISWWIRWDFRGRPALLCFSYQYVFEHLPNDKGSC